MSPYNIAGLISEESEEVATQIANNCRRRQPHSHLTPPPRGPPANIPIHLIFTETRIIGLHFCRSLIVCSGLQKTHLFCDRLRFGRSRSFRVIQGRWFWYQSNLAPFLRYGDYWLKIAYFSYPCLIRRLCYLWNFALKLTMRKLRVSEDHMIVAWVVLTQCQHETDGQTDGRIYYS